MEASSPPQESAGLEDPEREGVGWFGDGADTADIDELALDWSEVEIPLHGDGEVSGARGAILSTAEKCPAGEEVAVAELLEMFESETVVRMVAEPERSRHLASW